MDDFSTPGVVNLYGFPASRNNFVEPGKMPMSSMCPTIVFDSSGNVVYLAGGSGGSRITTTTAFVRDYHRSGRILQLKLSGVARGCGLHRAALYLWAANGRKLYFKNSRENSDCKFRMCLRAIKTKHYMSELYGRQSMRMYGRDIKFGGDVLSLINVFYLNELS